MKRQGREGPDPSNKDGVGRATKAKRPTTKDGLGTQDTDPRNNDWDRRGEDPAPSNKDWERQGAKTQTPAP